MKTLFKDVWWPYQRHIECRGIFRCCRRPNPHLDIIINEQNRFYDNSERCFPLLRVFILTYVFSHNHNIHCSRSCAVFLAEISHFVQPSGAYWRVFGQGCVSVTQRSSGRCYVGAFFYLLAIHSHNYVAHA